MVPFNFQRQRDFGEIISDSFTFFKDNFKSLMRPLLTICGFFIVICGISYGIFQNQQLEFQNQVMSNPQNLYDVPTRTAWYWVSFGIYYLSFLLLTFSISLTTYCYIAVYKTKETDEKPTMLEVWGYYKYYFWRCVGAGILVLLLVGAGTVLCVLPGIYVAVALSLVLPVMVIENTSFSVAISKAFNLIKGNWWATFGIIFIMSLIVGIISGVGSVPVVILTILKMVMKLDFNLMPFFVIAGVIYCFLMLAQSLLAISSCLCYFSYEEQKEGTGLLNRIDNLGQQKNDDNNLPAEEY